MPELCFLSPQGVMQFERLLHHLSCVTTTQRNGTGEVRNTDLAAAAAAAARGWGMGETTGFLNNSQRTPKTVKRSPTDVLHTPEAQRCTRLRNAFRARCPWKYTEWSVSWQRETRPYNSKVEWEQRCLGLTLISIILESWKNIKSRKNVVISDLFSKPPIFHGHVTFTNQHHFRFLCFSWASWQEVYL